MLVFFALQYIEEDMNRDILLYGMIGVLAITTAVLGYKYYKEQQQPSGIEISIGKRGIKIEEK